MRFGQLPSPCDGWKSSPVDGGGCLTCTVEKKNGVEQIYPS